MANKYIRTEDGRYQVVHPTTGVPIGEAMTSEQLLEMKTYESKNLSPRMEAGSKRGVERRNAEKLNKVYENLDLTEKLEDPEYAEQYKRFNTGVDLPGADVPGFLKTTGLHMLDKFDEMGNGISDIIDSMEYAVTEDPQLLQDKIDRDNERDALTTSMPYDALQEATDVSKIGSMIPFLATGQLEYPLGATLLKGSQHLSKLKDLKLARLPDSSPFTSDIKTGAMNRLEALPQIDPYDVGRAEQYRGAAMVGAGEGAILDDRTAEGGLLENIAGTSVGRILSGPGRKTENLRNTEETDIMTRAKRLGKRYLQGVVKGDREKQIIESTMRGNPYMVNKVNRWDTENNSIDNKVVAKALDIDNPDGLPMVDKIIAKRNKVKGQFDALSKETKGRFSKTGLKRLQAKKAEYLQQPTTGNNEALAELDSYLSIFDRWRGQKNNKYLQDDFDGVTYQRERSRLDRDIKAAKANNKPEVAEVLESVRNELDAAIRNGSGSLSKTGQNQLDRWEKAREDYALIDMVSEEGLMSSGNIDMIALHNYFMKNNKERYLSGNDVDRFADVFTLTRAEEMKRGMQDAGLGNKPIEGFATPRTEYNLNERGFRQRMNPMQEATMFAYRNDVAGRGFGPEFSGMAGRGGGSAMQTYAPHEEAVNGLNDIKHYVMQLLEEWDKDPTQDPNGATQ